MHHPAVVEHRFDDRQPLLGSGRPLSEKSGYSGGARGRESLMPESSDFPMPEWTWAIRDSTGKRTLPQTIAHRGYKAEHPENTMRAFQGAVEVGAHAIETDIHLSKDNVVVLSHDADLKRCFGVQEKIIDCNWNYLKGLRTLKAPHEPMPSLKQLLEYLAPFDHLWLLLDIKLDNDCENVMRLIAETIKSVDAGTRPWNKRIVLGIWAAKYLPICCKYLPAYPITHIGFSTCYAKQFLKVPNISFNMLQKVLLGPIGTRFIRDVQEAHRPLFVWTINEDNMMKWSIQKRVDGVITDDPKRFKRICDEWSDSEPIARASLFQWLYTFCLYVMIAIFIIPFRRRFPETVENFIKRKELKAKATLKLGA